MPALAKMADDKICLTPGCGEKAAFKGLCRNCYQRDWRSKHPKKVREYSRDWRRRNTRHVRAYNRKRKQEHPVKHYPYTKKWRYRHPGKRDAQTRRYYRKHSVGRMNSGLVYTDLENEMILERCIINEETNEKRSVGDVELSRHLGRILAAMQKHRCVLKKKLAFEAQQE